MSEPLVVICAPNGARMGRDRHPAVPLTPAELAEAARALVDAGVSVLHLHVRDAHGRHSLAVADYRAALTAIRAAVGKALVLQVTTEAAGRYSRAEQMALVSALRPEAVSLALR
ncbi:MAG: 3-keto-5-aminohexanoate cleavage protein, partial [Xanthomonadales bacterium]|nr:3-keto-5-aminohexanoate cleavage protein [Xanthomonadales bacterium]